MRAGGGLVYRKRKGGVEVLVVHRPSYDDWSFPKGKQNPGEKLKETALREVEEETGYRCRLKGWVGQVRYPVGRNQVKEVSYWAMKIKSGRFRPNDEVDEVWWVEPDRARELLTWPRDVNLLGSFLDRCKRG
ncbi:MAG: NUDIX hydrolase [Acidimicrobiales bacterium]|nr:NUDIX hydrolase [Acidimicrobiales bacterium]